MSSGVPLMPDVGVLCLVTDRWTGLWQARHHVMSRLPEYFYVVWANPAEEWRDVARSPLRRPFSSEPRPGLTVYSPDLLLPRFYKPRSLDELTTRLRLRGAARILRRAGCSKLVLYLWRDVFHEVPSMLPHDLCVYHIDDEYTYEMSEQPIPAFEAKLLEQADEVIIHSPGLLAKKGSFNPHTSFVPNGVDYEAYSKPGPVPSDLEGVPRPVIGYTGQIKKQLDWELLEGLASRHPEWSFVMVGPVSPTHGIESTVESFGRRDNVWLLGAKSPDELATYPRHFDVCVMPYALNAYTRYIYPLKLNEYLASGQPVVGTRIWSLQAFSAVVTLASGVEEWSNAIFAALDADALTEERRRARQAVALDHDWGGIVARIALIMAQGLGPAFRERLESSLSPGLRQQVRGVMA